jgi:hypothetical protein
LIGYKAAAAKSYLLVWLRPCLASAVVGGVDGLDMMPAPRIDVAARQKCSSSIKDCLTDD